ncbi:MAG: hypothetical protein M3Y87_16950 [Myxococcota bacterium]|nr:hypothetical protein [Myxococcota bacterium]
MRRAPGLERLPEISLVASVAVFLALGALYAQRLPVWHEVVSALPSSGYRVLDSDESRRGEDALPLEPSCTEPSPPRLVFSSSRPNLGVCVAGQTLPLMITSYASGVATWPFALAHGLHGDDTFALRLVWLCVAALSLVLLFRLVSRVADRTTAAIACGLTAVSTPFVMINALLLPFETLPSTFLVAALAIWIGARPVGDAIPSPGMARVALGAVLIGLALATNLKAAFFVVPLAAFAWRTGARWRLGARQRVALATGILVPLVPSIVFAVLDPHDGFTSQVSIRTDVMLENLRADRLLTEPVMLFNFAADVTSYVVLVARRGGIEPTWMHVAVALPITYCVVASATHFAGRPRGSRLAAACGAVIATYFLASLLLYRQYPGGNYAPLHDVFGVAMAAGCVDGARFAKELAGRRNRAFPPATAVAVALAGMIAFGSVGNLLARADAIAEVGLTTNARAERALAAYLRSVPDRSTLVLTTTYNDAGVLDALGRGRVRAVQAHDLLARCDSGERQGIAACLRDRLRWLLTRTDALPMRVTIPTALALVDRPREVLEALPDALEEAARELGLESRVERTFDAREGVTVTTLHRIEAPPGWTPPRRGAAPTAAPIAPAAAPLVSPPPAPVSSCAWYVRDANVRLVHAALVALDADDGCELESVIGERSALRIRWRVSGAVSEAVSLEPSACVPDGVDRGAVLAISVPASVESACPATVDALRALALRDAFGELAPAAFSPGPGP